MQAYAVQLASRNEGSEAVGGLVRDGYDVPGERPRARGPDQKRATTAVNATTRPDGAGWVVRARCQISFRMSTIRKTTIGDQTCTRLSIATTISSIAAAIGTPFFCEPSR